MKNENDQLEIQGHSYDGITEYDNPMPTWWLWTFFITIIFAFHYFIHYIFGGGATLNEELAIAMEKIEKNKTQTSVVLESEENLIKIMNKDETLGLGESTFNSKCSACHGSHLQGSIGPNLTDKYWLHGSGTRVDIIKVVRDGVPDKGMPPWSQMMSQDESYAVTAYIVSKIGSNPVNPKPPQGKKVE